MDPSAIIVGVPVPGSDNPNEYVVFRAQEGRAGSAEALYLLKLKKALFEGRAFMIFEKVRLVFLWPENRDHGRVVIDLTDEQLERLLANETERLSRGTTYEALDDMSGIKIRCTEPRQVMVESFKAAGHHVNNR